MFNLSFDTAGGVSSAQVPVGGRGDSYPIAYSVSPRRFYKDIQAGVTTFNVQVQPQLDLAALEAMEVGEDIYFTVYGSFDGTSFLMGQVRVLEVVDNGGSYTYNVPSGPLSINYTFTDSYVLTGDDSPVTLTCVVGTQQDPINNNEFGIPGYGSYGTLTLTPFGRP